MKRFVTQLLVFAIPLLLVGGILEYEIRTTDSYYRQKINGLKEHAGNIELLILGSSHAAEGIDPARFNLKAYNMAMGSQTLYYDQKITRKFLDKLTSLKYVLISIDYQSLYYPHNPSRDIFYHYYYGIDYEEQNYLAEDFSHFFLGFKPDISFKMIVEKVERLNLGWFGYDTTYYSSFLAEKVNRRINHFDEIIRENYENKQEILLELELFIQDLGEAGVVPLLISSPLHTCYSDRLDKKIVEQNKHDINYLCEKYGLQYWSFEHEYFEDREFLDNSHLNRSGAGRYSSMLNNRLSLLSSQTKTAAD